MFFAGFEKTFEVSVEWWYPETNVTEIEDSLNFYLQPTVPYLDEEIKYAYAYAEGPQGGVLRDENFTYELVAETYGAPVLEWWIEINYNSHFVELLDYTPGNNNFSTKILSKWNIGASQISASSDLEIKMKFIFV